MSLHDHGQPPADDADVEYHLTYLGNVIDAFDTLEEARAGRKELVRRIKANLIPDFLDADDIEGISDFSIHRTRVTW